MQNQTMPKPRRWAFLLLFASASTLLCCALPIVLVSLGMGAVVASLAGNLPWLVTLSQYKGVTFSVTAVILVLAAWALFRPGRVCPTDPALAAACNAAQTWNRRFYWVAVGLWLIGLAAAYLLPLCLDIPV